METIHKTINDKDAERFLKAVKGQIGGMLKDFNKNNKTKIKIDDLALSLREKSSFIHVQINSPISGQMAKIFESALWDRINLTFKVTLAQPLTA